MLLDAAYLLIEIQISFWSHVIYRPYLLMKGSITKGNARYRTVCKPLVLSCLRHVKSMYLSLASPGLSNKIINIL